MLGHRFFVLFAIIIVVAVASLMHSSRSGDATTFRPSPPAIRLCADGTGAAIPSFTCTPSTATNANLDSVTSFDIPAPDANFTGIVTYTPDTFDIATDAALPDGAIVGQLQSVVTLGLINGGCFSQLLVEFTFVDATTDFLNAGKTAVDPAKLITPAGPPDNLLLNLGEDDGDWDNNQTVEHSTTDNDGGAFGTQDGIPDGASGFPSYLVTLLDPDGTGPKLPIEPRARYFGVTVVPASPSGTVVILQFLIFDPGDLRVLVGGGANLPSLGFPAVTVLQDPTAAPTNGTITDFCSPLASTTHLDGNTRDNLCTDTTLPSSCNFSVSAAGVTRTVRIAQEDGTCGTTSPNECPGGTGGARITSPGSTGTVAFVAQSSSFRDLDDGDDHENFLDPCFATDDTAWDPRSSATFPTPGDTDSDGLPNSCDPSPMTFDPDQDGDEWQNRLDSCPLIKNGDTTLSSASAMGATTISVADTAGFPTPPFDILVDAGSIAERRTVTSVTAGTPGSFDLNFQLLTSHLGPPNEAPVAQFFVQNVNFGQLDIDVPFPNVVLEGPRGEGGVGTQCDTGTVGSDTLDVNSPQGHFHDTATLARVCITNNPGTDDVDGDGVCNTGGGLIDANDGNVDQDGDSTAPGEAERIYRDNDSSGTVTENDTRLSPSGNDAGGTTVPATSIDGGQPLLGFLANEKHTDDETANNDYDVNECIYRDVDNSGDVTTGDIRLRVDVAPDVTATPGPVDASPECNFAPQSVVACAGDSDCTDTLVPFDANEKHIDSRGPGLTETAYRDIAQTCLNRLTTPTDDGDFLSDFADSDCLGLHFDTYDNCISVANSAPAGFTQTDLDTDAIGDACESTIDEDADGTSDSLEAHIGTGIETICSRSTTANDETVDAQPEDLNDDRSITGADLSLVAADIGTTVAGGAPVRSDLAPEPAGDGSITGADLSKVAAKIGTACPF